MSLLNSLNNKQLNKFFDQITQLINVKKAFRTSSAEGGRVRHLGITCNFCEQPDLEGDRYACTVCTTSYNLCSRCFCSSRYNHSHELHHPCLCLSAPLTDDLSNLIGLEALANQYRSEIHHDVMCDKCKKEIRGVRIKCDQCYSLDMCYQCWKSQHHADKQHQLILYVSDIIKEIPFSSIVFERELGSGCFGTVYLAHIRPSGNRIACKMVKNSSENSMAYATCLDSIIKEIDAHREIRSAYVCRLFGFARGPASELCMVLEYMDQGSLDDLLRQENSGQLSLPLLRKIKMMADVASGLEDIHKKGFIHTDIKPDNILVEASFIAKISDLGIIKNRNVRESNYIGNNMYLPPEFQTGVYDNTVDVYSYGLVMYHFFGGRAHRLESRGSGGAQLLVLDNTDAIKLEFVRKFVTTCVDYTPAMRQRISFYRSFLRNYEDMADALLKSRDLFDTYKSGNATKKDEILFSLNQSILDGVNNRYRLKQQLLDNGVSYNELYIPKIDNLVSHYATASTSDDEPVKRIISAKGKYYQQQQQQQQNMNKPNAKTTTSNPIADVSESLASFKQQTQDFFKQKKENVGTKLNTLKADIMLATANKQSTRQSK